MLRVEEEKFDLGELKKINSSAPLSAIEMLPPELKKSILNHLPDKDIILAAFQLSHTSKNMFKFFNPELEQQAARKLLQLILHNKESEALKMIARYQPLLFIKSSAIDFAGREIQASPYQAIIGMVNFSLFDKTWPFIRKMVDGLDFASNQFIEQFSNITEKKYNFPALITIISREKFIQKKLNSVTEEAFKAFKNEFNSGCIKEGHHFNLNHLTEALNAYFQCLKQLNTQQATLYWIKVIGYLQKLIPTYHFINIFGKNAIPLIPKLGEDYALYNSRAVKLILNSAPNDPIEKMKKYIENYDKEFEKIKNVILNQKLRFTTL